LSGFENHFGMFLPPQGVRGSFGRAGKPGSTGLPVVKTFATILFQLSTKIIN